MTVVMKLVDILCSQMADKENGLTKDYFDAAHRRDLSFYNMSLVMRKPAFCICENKDADQLRGNREADQHLCFRFTDSTIPLLPKSEIPSL